jgi:hypothetical protein
MAAPCLRFLSARFQFFQAILANRFQHHEARFAVRLLRLANQTLVHHRRHPIEDVQSKILFRVADRFDCFQGAAPQENGESSEKFLLRLAQQVIAPVHGGAKRLLSVYCRPTAAR